MLNDVKKKLKKEAKLQVHKIYRRIFARTKTDHNRIVFDSNAGANYTGSPRAIYEYMVEHHMLDNYDVVWFFTDKAEHEPLPGNPRIVRYNRWQYLWEMCHAHVWVFDSRNPGFLKKRKDQHYIQIWHGTPLKRLALDMDNCDLANQDSLESYKLYFFRNTRAWDYMVVQNEFSADIFHSCFAFDRVLLRTGYPRNDVLFAKNNPSDIRAIKEQLGIPLDKKVLLYAPTFRDDEFDESGAYTITPRMDFRLMMDALKDDYVLIVKYHYLIANAIDWTGYEGFVYSFNTSMDINLLYLISDEMITDYSSVMFDYSLLHRPMYFYCYDLEKYAGHQRGFYFDFQEEAPGPISLTTEELLRDIQLPADEKERLYGEKRQAFYNKFHTYENGTASKQIAEKIVELMESDRDNQTDETLLFEDMQG